MTVVATKPKPKVKPPVDPLLATARQAVDASVNPARDDITKAIAAAETARALQSQKAAEIAKAVAGMSSGDAEAARAAFASSADRIASYGQGLTGALRDVQGAAASKNAELIHTLGAPGAISSNADANSNTAYMTGAEIPAESLATRAATALLAQQDRRAATGSRILDTSSAMDFKSGADIKTIRDQLLALEAKRPGLIQDALAALHQQANAKRATDTQVGYLQLQQAKTVQDQAVAMTNLTGTLHIVVGTGDKQRVVDTGKSALGSDAAVVQQRAAQADADRNARIASAKAANQTRLTIAKTAADAKIAAASAAAEAKKAAAEVAAQRAQNKPATAAQKATIIRGADKSGNSIVSAKINTWYANTPNLAPQQKNESLEDYAKRHAQGVKEFNNKKAYNFKGVVNTVTQTIAPQLQLLGWTPAQIAEKARAIVAAQIVPPPGQ